METPVSFAPYGASPNELPPLVLAYVGDACFNLFVRQRLLTVTCAKVRKLHNLSAKIVSAVCQSRAYHEIEPLLTEDERGIFRRGRNAKSHTPRSATVGEYHDSTGFEALIGSLYLSGDHKRLNEILEAAIQAIAKDLNINL